jgi:DNA repair photolyase
MGLNKRRGEMYQFIDFTWNTVKGFCPHGCSYCYVKSEKQQPIRIDIDELKTDLETGHFIFVGSGNDLFADDVPKKWIDTTIDHCAKFNNWYLFQTKNPKRYAEFDLPQKFDSMHNN